MQVTTPGRGRLGPARSRAMIGSWLTGLALFAMAWQGLQRQAL